MVSVILSSQRLRSFPCWKQTQWLSGHPEHPLLRQISAHTALWIKWAFPFTDHAESLDSLGEQWKPGQQRCWFHQEDERMSACKWNPCYHWHSWLAAPPRCSCSERTSHLPNQSAWRLQMGLAGQSSEGHCQTNKG
jgi:hypothetical protein